jgi:hypothetical protein
MKIAIGFLKTLDIQMEILLSHFPEEKFYS